MATVTCPQGHSSEATDYCDTCGTAIAAGSPPAGSEPAPTPEAAPAEEAGAAPMVGTCPECGTPRIEGEAFCEVCGLDYTTGKLPAPPQGTPAPADPGPATPAASGWTVTIEADEQWHAAQEFEDADVPFPEDPHDRTLDLAGDVVSIGRRSEGDGWYPDIDLSQGHDDLAASRRHAELRWTGDGWTLVDLDSTNGTSLNGTPVPANEPRPLADGDRINLGGFTRIVLHAPPEA